MTDIPRILAAKAPLTLSSVPLGFQPLLLADLARAKQGRTLFIAADDAAMRQMADTVRFFAPELDVIPVPAWDCLPYDRASPALALSAERFAALHALQTPVKRAQIVLTTVNAATQRTLTPFRIRQLVQRLAPGQRVN